MKLIFHVHSSRNHQLKMDQKNSDATRQLLLSAEEVAQIPLLNLPRAIRETSDAHAQARQNWWIAYANLREIRSRLTMHHHIDDKLQISAAEHEASINPAIADAAILSRELWEIQDALRRVTRQLKHELKVKLATTRSRPD